MTKENTLIMQQDVRTAILTLSHLTDRLRKELSSAEQNAVASKEEALRVLNALSGFANDRIDIDTLELQINEDHVKMLLQELLEDEAVKPALTPLLEHPPHYSQRSFEELQTVAVVLGCLITWLQTKVNIHVKRESGKTSFEFQVLKPKTTDAVVKKVIKTIQKLLGRKDEHEDKE